MERYQEIERSIITTYRSKIWSKFIKAIKEYELLKPNDKVCVCISGGKDSMILAKCFQELKRHSDFEFDLKFLVMNPGYNEENIKRIEENLKILNIDAVIKKTDIFEIANAQIKNPCYLCARMRRGALYRLAEELGCNKIALGHHLDDAAETFMMNLLTEGRIGCFSPVTLLEDKNISIIRPLVLTPEKDVRRAAKNLDLPILKLNCPADGTTNRQHTKELISKLERENHGSKMRIFGAMQRDLPDWRIDS